jgi:hypothetical protein
MVRLGLLIGVLAACDGGADSTPDPIDISAAWRVHCVGCVYPEHVFEGPIADDDPDGRYVLCNAIDDQQLDISFGVVTRAEAPGFSINVKLGFDGSAFDLDRLCQVQLGEADDRIWGDTCSATPLFPCQVTAPRLTGEALAFSLRCVNMSAIPQPAGTAADLTSASSAMAPIDVQISRCRL